MKKSTGNSLGQPDFLPMTRLEMDRLGWDEIDVLIVTGDAYVDHPCFGPALLGRWLVAHGYRTGLIAQPDWRDPASVTVLGRPRLLAGVTAGALDSMLAHFTAFRKKRSDDAYTPGGRSGARPNRASIVYSNLIRQAFAQLPLVLGGIEASLRRAVHYDFWSDKLRRSILLDAKADLLVYGMGERALLEAVRRLDEGSKAGFSGLRGTVLAGDPADLPSGERVVVWPSLEEIQAEPFKLMEASLAMERQVHLADHWAVQTSAGRGIILAPPAEPLSSKELDRLFALGYTRRAHPVYQEPIPAETMLASSLNTHRGCGGGCTFCSLALHQGRRVRSRTRESILVEAQGLVARSARGKASISDVGGPSAGMWGALCQSEKTCLRPSCLYPKPCPHFRVDQRANIALLREIRALAGINHVRVASGLRFDLALEDIESLKALTGEFVGGQLKVAPEHVAPEVLKLMRKPEPRRFEEFMEIFDRASREAGLRQYLTPYFMSAFPGTTDRDMALLAGWLQKRGWKPQQVQCFVPTPGTVATAMYYSQKDQDGRSIFVARTDAARMRQHHMIVPKAPEKGRRQVQKRSPQRRP